MTSPFASVPSAEELKQNKGPWAPWARFRNRLIVVRPLSYQKEGFITSNAPDGTDVAFVDVACLDAIPAALDTMENELPGFPAGQQFRNQTVLAGYLKGTFKRLLGQTLIGTIELGVATKGRPPMHFKDLSADAAAVARGTMFLQQHPEFLQPVVPEFNGVEVIDTTPPSYRGQPAPQQAQLPPQPAGASSLEEMRNLAAGGYTEEPPY